ncbi:sodium channel modifier 1-like, partial [Lingula anatina]|uniref:Sodium channel modifier 1-like n=1 Tax=Lingula anatina TaxID=7574 RepID=A0A1S3JYY1_LINAN
MISIFTVTSGCQGLINAKHSKENWLATLISFTMSFKREGDDHSLLQQIRKRRIEELFAYDIPEKEALLLRDGRFTCTICPHRPLFDTIAVLAVHRQGKKHKANNVKQEDIHPMVSNSGTSAAQQTSQPQRIKNESSCGNALMSAASYNPCVKRNKEDKDTRIELDRNISSTSILKRLANFQQHDSIPTDFRPYKSKRRTNTTPVETLYSSQQAVKDNEPPAKSRNLQQLSEARPVSLDKTTNNVEVFNE